MEKNIEDLHGAPSEEARTTNTNHHIPDKERRRLLKKMAVAAVTIPTVTILLDGRTNITFATP